MCFSKGLSFMIKKILLLIFVAFFVLVHFAPMESDGYKIRNLPLLFAIIGLFILLVLLRHTKTLFFTLKTVKLLKNNSVQIKKLLVLLKTACVVAEDKSQAYVIHIYRGVNQKYRYHFENNNILEVYKTLQTTFSTRRHTINGVKMTLSMRKGAIRTERSERKKLFSLKCKSNKSVCDIVLLNKFPEHLSDFTTDKRRCPISEGDEICSSATLLYSLDGLEKRLNNSGEKQFNITKRA